MTDSVTSQDEFFDEEKIQTLRSQFFRHDQSGNGTISIDELENLLGDIGIFPSRVELSEIMQEADKDQSGSLDFQEFLDLMKDFGMYERVPEKEMREVFKVFDRNGSGNIPASDLRVAMMTVLPSLTEREVKDILRLMDPNLDGYITVEDLVQELLRDEKDMIY